MKEENNIVNLDKFKKTRSITQAEREQRIKEWKVSTLVEAIKKGKPSDGLNRMEFVLTSVNKAELNEAKKEIVEILNILESIGYKEQADQYRWALQKYLN